MPKNAEVYRETVVDERTSATAGTATVTTTDGAALLSLSGMGLESFDELIIHIKTSTSLAGTTPTMDIYFQRAVHPSADPTNAAHWQDILSFPQITAAMDEVGTLPFVPAPSAATSQMVDATRPREQATITADRANPGHWGDRLRIVEKMGGTVTTQAIYSIHITGRIH